MTRWLWPAALLLVIGAGVAGYFSVPHYHPAPAADAARLRERAVCYYRASRQLDLQGMAQLFTPAHQLQRTGDLKENVTRNAAGLAQVDAARRTELKQAAAAITADKVEVEVEGDWAVTKGTYTTPAQGHDAAARLPLEPTVWLRTGGDWWVYLLEPDELACYGNPPEFARQYVATHNFNPQLARRAAQLESK